MNDIAGLEVELKLQAASGQLDELAAVLASAGVRFKRTAMRAQYFDTPDLRLRQAGFSLRVRRSGKNRVQTLKAEGADLGALFARPEWERAVDSDRPIIDETAGPLRSLLPDGDLDVLRPAFSVKVTRRLGAALEGTSQIEAVVDQGVIKGNGSVAEVAEVELELKEGSPAALFALARKLDEVAPVKLGVLTKAERGYRLLDGTADKPSRGERGIVSATSTTGEAFQAIAGACLRQFRLNEDLLSRAEDPDVLHQARVALRRLRSALSIFRQVVADSRFDHLRAELRWLAATLGEARDIDVLIARTRQREVLADARIQAYARVAEALASARARTLMLDLAEWLAIGGWRTAPANPAVVNRPASEFAAAMLDRLRRRLKKRGKHLRSVDDGERHEVRIDAKKLRYAAEFFAGLFPGAKKERRARRFIGAMQELQAHLGDLNDMATEPVLLAQLGVAIAPVPAPDQARLLKASADAYDELMDRRRFWD